MDNRIRFTSMLFCVLLFSSCILNKDTYLKSFEKFVQDVELKEHLNESDYEKIDKQYTEFTESYYQKYIEELTMQDKTKIVKLKVRYYKSLARHGLKNAGNKLNEIGDEALEFMDILLK